MPEIKEIDFSQFHALDHTVWKCNGYYGGRRVHLKYRWQFQWRDKLCELTLCKLRRHKRVQWWNRRGDSGFQCRNCMKDME